MGAVRTLDELRAHLVAPEVEVRPGLTVNLKQVPKATAMSLAVKAGALEGGGDFLGLALDMIAASVDIDGLDDEGVMALWTESGGLKGELFAACAERCGLKFVADEVGNLQPPVPGE